MVDTNATWMARPESPVYDEMRTRLIDAAETVVLDEGVAALRLEAVAEIVGCHRSSVYRYFKNKEELVTAVVVRATLQIGNRTIDGLAGEDDPAVMLVEGIIRSLADIRSSALYQSLSSETGSPAVARIAGNVMSEALQPLLQPVLAASAETDGFRADITPDEAMRWLMIVVSGLQQRPRVIEDEAALRSLLRKMLVPVLLDRS